jgi:hypothetical protein
MRISSGGQGLKARHNPAQWQRLGYDDTRSVQRPARAIYSFSQSRFIQIDGNTEGMLPLQGAGRGLRLCPRRCRWAGLCRAFSPFAPTVPGLPAGLRPCLPPVTARGCEELRETKQSKAVQITIPAVAGLLPASFLAVRKDGRLWRQLFLASSVTRIVPTVPVVPIVPGLPAGWRRSPHRDAMHRVSTYRYISSLRRCPENLFGLHVCCAV